MSVMHKCAVLGCVLVIVFIPWRHRDHHTTTHRTIVRCLTIPAARDWLYNTDWPRDTLARVFRVATCPNLH